MEKKLITIDLNRTGYGEISYDVKDRLKKHIESKIEGATTSLVQSLLRDENTWRSEFENIINSAIEERYAGYCQTETQVARELDESRELVRGLYNRIRGLANAFQHINISGEAEAIAHFIDCLNALIQNIQEQ